MIITSDHVILYVHVCITDFSIVVTPLKLNTKKEMKSLISHCSESSNDTNIDDLICKCTENFFSIVSRIITKYYFYYKLLLVFYESTRDRHDEKHEKLLCAYIEGVHLSSHRACLVHIVHT